MPLVVGFKPLFLSWPAVMDGGRWKGRSLYPRKGWETMQRVKEDIYHQCPLELSQLLSGRWHIHKILHSTQLVHLPVAWPRFVACIMDVLCVYDKTIELKYGTVERLRNFKQSNHNLNYIMEVEETYQIEIGKLLKAIWHLTCSFSSLAISKHGIWNISLQAQQGYFRFYETLIPENGN